MERRKLIGLIALFCIALNAKATIDSSNYINSLYKEAIYVYLLSNDSYCEKVEMALACAERNTLLKEIRFGKALKGNCIDEIQDSTSLKILLFEVIKDAEIHFDKRTLLVGYSSLAGFYHNTERFQKGLAYYQKALSFATKEKDNDITSIINYSISHLFFELQMWDQSIIYAKVAEQQAQQIGNKSVEYFALDLLISNYDDVPDSLSYYSLKAAALKKELQSSTIDFLSYQTKADLFQLNENFDSAGFYLKKAYLISVNQEHNYWMNYTLARLGQNAYYNENFKEAKNYFLKRAETVDSNAAWVPYWKYQEALIEYALSNHKIANELFMEYFKYEEELYREENVDKLAYLNARFQKLEDENKIKDQALELERNKNNWNKLWGIFSFLIALILGIGYVLNRRAKFQREMLTLETDLHKRKIHQLEQNQKLTKMSSLLEGQEAERIRIAKDLHDGLGSLLTTVKVHVGKVQEQIQKIENLKVFDSTQEMIDMACEEIRRISHNLMPATLRAEGLVSAVQQIVNQLNQVHQIETELETHGFEKRLEESTEVLLYRVIQEISNNIVKHAHATKVWVQLFEHVDNIQILVEDNGVGFNPSSENLNGYGLNSMQSRVEHLEGSIDIDSRKNQGTSITINVPK